VKLDYEVRQALALRVAKPGSSSLLIGPDNLANGWADIEEAAGRDLCHAVDPRAEYLALDLDHHHGEDQAFRIAARCRELGFDAVIVNSGRRGHAHLWVWAGEYRDVLAAEAAQIVGPVGYGPGGGPRLDQRMRPPMARHRHGGRAEVVNMSPEDALKVLDSKKLSREASAYLRQEGPSPNRSAALLSSAEAFVTARLTFEEWAQRIDKHPDAAKYRDRKDRSRELGRCWTKAKKRLCRIEAMLPRRHNLAQYIAAAWTAPGLGNGTQEALACIYGIAERAENLDAVHISQRDLALDSGAGLRTAQRRLEKLQEAGYIQVAQAPTAKSATRYALCLKKLVSKNDDPPSLDKAGGGVREGSQNLTHLSGTLGEALLGRPAQKKVWMALPSDSPITARELAAKLEKKPGTLRDQLRKLQQAGLAETANGVWWRVDDPIAHREAAKDRSTLGRFACRRRETERRRVQRAEAIANGEQLNDIKPESWVFTPRRRKNAPYHAPMAGQTSTAKGAPLAVVYAPMRV
jgi:DNA-binding transcriptional regulator YhcF (GntR family)